jgi:outer membrane protein assembly complex protein YaeT
MDSYEGLPISQVNFPDITNPKDTDSFVKLLALKPGDVLTRDNLRESIQKLYATGRFADIRAEGNIQAGQVVLSFRTSAAYFVGQMAVVGNPPRPTASQVTNASKLTLGALYTPDKQLSAIESINQLMRENGFYQSSVTIDEEQHPETQQILLTFEVHPGPQAKVGSVQVKGDSTSTTEQIEDATKLRPGKPVSVQAVSNALERLRKRYQKQNRWLSQVTLAQKEYQPPSNTVDYTFLLDRGPVVRVVVEGYKIRRGTLRKNVPVYDEHAADDDLLNEGRRNLLNYMQDSGYFAAKVSVNKTASRDQSELLIVYDIDPGARHKLVKVQLEGNHYFPDDLLRSRMKVQQADRFIAPRGHYSQALLNSDIRTLQALYQNSGFQKIAIHSEVKDDYLGVKNQIAVVLQVEEGPQSLVGGLQIKGNQAVPFSDFPPLNISEGQPFSQTNVAADRDILLNFYYNQGFSNASFEATAMPESDNPDRMLVTYTITEGEQLFVDQVLLSGLNHTRPHIVQRDLQVKPGDPLSPVALLKTQQSLYDLGIFSQVDTAVQNPDGMEASKNVLVAVQEAKRYTFNYGIGFEFQTGQPAAGLNQPLGQTGVSPLVSFDVTRLNFRGLDHTVAFKLNLGRLQQRGLVSYEAPRWFNNPAWRLTFTAFYDNTVDVTTFTSERLEGSVQAQETISKASILTYRFSYRRVLATNIEISANLIPLLSQPTRVGGPGLSYIRNRRDNDLESTKGSYWTADLSVASGYFGSEADFSRILVQNNTYKAFGQKRNSTRKFVFARSTRVGVENPFGNTTTIPPGEAVPAGQTLIPLAERFLSGGGNSHRGFGLNQAGPRDPQTGYPLGGSALFLNSFELRLPPTNLPYVKDNLSFAIFEDAGNVFVDGRTMLNSLLHWRQKDPQLCLQSSTAAQCDYNYVSHAVGIGVRYKTPVGPVRFDFGYNLNPPAFPSCQTTGTSSSSYCPTTSPYFDPQHASHFNVYFSIGQTF